MVVLCRHGSPARLVRRLTIEAKRRNHLASAGVRQPFTNPDLELKLGSPGIPELRKLGIYVLGLARH
jgi:hypothetical protein